MLNILFIQDNVINESLALTELGGALRDAGHHVRLVLTDHERDADAEIRRLDPALAVIPCPVTGHEIALAHARRIKRVAPRCVVVLGGTHATLSPEIVEQPDVDAICQGEADAAIVTLADRIAHGRDWADVPNLVLQRDGQRIQNPLGPLIEPLDKLAMPARDLYFRYPFLARFPWKKFVTGRGCIHACNFCWNPTIADLYGTSRGNFTRRKSPRRAIDEIRAVKERWPLRSVHFSDDLFTVRSAWLEEFAGLYRAEIGVPFTCNSSIELVTPRNIAALKEAGCRGVCIGVETGNEQLRSKMLNKTVTNDDVRAAARLIKGAGFKLITFNMIASPGETLQDAFSTVALNREIGADYVRVNVAVPLPHTGFEAHSLAEGHLDPDYLKHRVTSMKTPTVAFRTADARSFQNLFYLFWPLIHMPTAEPLLRRLVHLPITPALDLLRLFIPFEEKRINNLRWIDGLRFFPHVGDPHKRNTTYVTLI